MGKLLNFPKVSRQAKFKEALEWVFAVRDKAQRETEKLGELPARVLEVIAHHPGSLSMFAVKIAGRRLRCIECNTLMSVGDYYFSAGGGARECVACADSEVT